jgi:GT2 family glycosyltransferase
MEEAVTAGGMAHHQALEMLAARALAEGDATAAFALADRRCRIRPAPEAHSFVLRAETHQRLGRRRPALADLESALAIAPEDIAANRRMLAWGRGEARTRAARALVRIDRDLATLIAAVGHLESRSERVFASLQVFAESVRGWVAWHGDAAVSVTVAGDLQSTTTYIEPEPSHPLAAGPRHAATFEVARAPCAGPQAVYVSMGGSTHLSVDAPPNAPVEPKAARSSAEGTGGVTVIVPVYADYEATRSCLDRLVAELGREGRHRAVIVNDAAPDARMAPYLRRIAAKPAVTLLTNPRNLGFVAAVNRALAAALPGDVILLNADTVPPPGFIDRLTEAARRRPGIGVVTAFSNDAEMTSFPIPDRANRLGSAEDAIALDRIAAVANAGRIVDLPSATGFCLYMTQACRDGVGPLSATFHRGYMEDVDLCLRARTLGFGTVCDTSLFVGHAGSRSFGTEKAALALRNFAVLAARHPDYAAECAAFADADPLRAARAAIELHTAPHGPARLVVTGTGTVAAIARRYADGLARQGEGARLLTLASGSRARLADAAGNVPQSLDFDLATPAGLDALAEAFHVFPPDGIDILDPAATPSALVALLLRQDCPLTVIVTDGGLFTPPGEPLARTPSPSATAWRRQWEPILARAAIHVPTREAQAFAERMLPADLAAKVAPPLMPDPPRRKPRKATRRLGMVVPAADPHARVLAGELARCLRRDAPDAPLVVLGDPPDAAGLLLFGNVAVTGPLGEDELPALCRYHEVGRLFVERRQPLFGHPLVEAARAIGLSLAFRDWSLGVPDGALGDLAIDPFAASSDVVTSLLRWMT